MEKWQRDFYLQELQSLKEKLALNEKGIEEVKKDIERVSSKRSLKEARIPVSGDETTTYPFAKAGTENNPVVIMFETVSNKFLHAWLGTSDFSHRQFGLLFLVDDKKKEFKSRCASFWDREWPLLDSSRQEEIREAFQKLNEAIFSPLNAWIEDIGIKMGISNLGNKGKKPKRSLEGIERFLSALQKDLKEKGKTNGPI